MRKKLAVRSVMARGGGSCVSLEGLLAIANMLFLCWFLGLAGCHHVDLLMRNIVDPVSAETFVTSIYLL